MTQEERDRDFQHRAIREALRLGLIAPPVRAASGCNLAQARIVHAVAARHGLTFEEVRSASRLRKVTDARAAAMRALHATGRWSLKQIAVAVGRSDHTTVMHALRTDRT